jgi:hypothetical protein
MTQTKPNADLDQWTEQWAERMATPLTDAVQAEWLARNLPAETLFGEMRSLERELKSTRASMERLMNAIDCEGIAVGDDGYCKNWRATNLEQEVEILRGALAQADVNGLYGHLIREQK